MENAPELSLRTLLHEGKIAAAHNKPLIFVFTSLSVFLFLRILKSANLPDWVLAIGSLVLYLFLFHFICLLIQSVKSHQITRIRFFLNMQFAALLGFLSAHFLVPQSWDSFILPGNLFALVTFIASLVLILPTIYQKIALLGLTAFHFFGLLCLTLPGFTDSFLSQYARAVVYHKLQKLLYLGNRYRVYSPNPPTFSPLLWIKITNEDNTNHWVFQPDFQNNLPIILSREKQMLDFLAASHFCLSKTDQQPIKGEDLFTENYFTPFTSDPFNRIFLSPSPETKYILPSFLRHISKKQTGRIQTMSCYLVFHKVVAPLEMSVRRTHRDRAMYYPFYLGDFDSSGALLNEKDPNIGFCLSVIEENTSPTSDGPPQTKDMFLLHSGLDISQMNQQDQIR